METISNATVTKCQRCGEWTNYADDAHYKVREAEKERLRGLCRWAAGRLLDAELTEERELVGRMYDTQAKRVARIVTGPGRTLFYVEVKAPGKKPTAAQLRDHERRRANGFAVYVIDSKGEVDYLLRGRRAVIAKAEARR